MKRPIPAPIAFLRLAGIALTIASRRLVSVSITNIRPSIRIAVRANCQEWPRPKHTVNTKNALSPIPGARAKGSFAHNDIIRVPVMAASAVAVNTEPAGIPQAVNMLGFTARMYAIVRNVVIPAIISVLSLFLVGSNPNSFCNIYR